MPAIAGESSTSAVDALRRRTPVPNWAAWSSAWDPLAQRAVGKPTTARFSPLKEAPSATRPKAPTPPVAPPPGSTTTPRSVTVEPERAVTPMSSAVTLVERTVTEDPSAAEIAEAPPVARIVEFETRTVEAVDSMAVVSPITESVPRRNVRELWVSRRRPVTVDRTISTVARLASSSGRTSGRTRTIELSARSDAPASTRIPGTDRSERAWRPTSCDPWRSTTAPPAIVRRNLEVVSLERLLGFTAKRAEELTQIPPLGALTIERLTLSRKSREPLATTTSPAWGPPSEPSIVIVSFAIVTVDPSSTAIEARVGAEAGPARRG